MTRFTHRGFDQADAFRESSGLDCDEFEALVAVGFFVDFLEMQGFLEGDTTGIGCRDEAKIADEEDTILVMASLLKRISSLARNCERGYPR